MNVAYFRVCRTRTLQHTLPVKDMTRRSGTVERAKELLRQRKRLPLAEVAAEVGISSQSHFTRHFKRLIGVRPRRFR